MSRADVQRLIDECWEAPNGAGRVALADAAIDRADALGDPDLRFEARLAGTEAYQRGGHPAKTFVTFSWCLAEFDRDPRSYGTREDWLLRWYFKWVVNLLTRFPEVPLSRTYAVLDDMERRYRIGGHSLQAVHQHRWLVAHHIGDADAAEEHYRKWITAPRDENSDCAGCDPTDRVMHLVAQGRDEEAVTLAMPVLDGQLTCPEQPQAMLTTLLRPYLRTGRLAEARDAHLRAYRAQRTLITYLGPISSHLEFCALTGNEARGLEIVSRHLPWLSRPPSPDSEMDFAASAALLLRRVTEAGQGDLPLGGSTVAEQAALLRARALELVARFDARNGTSHQGERIAARLDASPLVDALPLTAVDAAVRSAAAVSAPVRAAPAVVLPTGPAELIGYAERAYQLGLGDQGAAALAALAELDLLGGPAAARADLVAWSHAIAGRHDDAEAGWQAAIAAYTDLGDPMAAAVARGRLGVLWIQGGRTDEGLALVDRSVEFVTECGSRQQRIDVLLRRGQALELADRHEAALEVTRAAEALLQPDDDPLLAVRCATRRVTLHYLCGEHEEVVAAAARVYAATRALGEAPMRDGVGFMHGSALLALGRHTEAADVFAATIEAGPASDIVTAARANRGKALLALGRHAAAVDELVEAVAGFVAGGLAGPAAYSRRDLATAYLRSGESGPAAEMAEQAIQELDALGAAEAANRCRYLAANAYRELGLIDQALARLADLAERTAGAERAEVREEAAQLMYRQDRNAAAAAMFGVAAADYATAGRLLDQVRALRWQAVALRWAGAPDEALIALALADTAALTLPPDEPGAVWERAMLGYDAAQVHIGASRLDEALARIEPAAGLFRSIEALGESLRAQTLHAEVLLRLARPYDAEPLLRPVVAAAPDGTQLRASAAWLLAESLEGQGRTDEAEAVRREHDLE